MNFRKPTKPEVLIWSVIIIAFVCILTLCFIREKVVIPPPAPPPARGRAVMKKPSDEEISVLQKAPRPQDLPVVKKVGGDESLKKEEY